ncbi:MAG: glutamate--tRNA ligase [Candidatus Omnitrophica bacterium]|nr:glutamate--tRNA ligase [Candidatus Omnitrophota bacterium]
MTIRVRFAPSPTGYLHIGGVRTALFNYLYARGQQGKFFLRIEDTDRERSRPEFEQEILSSMTWLGLTWDGELVHQSKRLDHYQTLAHDLMSRGLAYEEVKEGKTAIKFKMPATKTVFHDLVHGPIESDTALFDDMVLIKSDGYPSYHWACVVDDHDMEISHVIRGDDHISNTPRQIQLFEAMGWKPPQYGHLPLILGEDGTPLSKRHGAVSLTAFKEQGFIPEGLLNYLSLLGWGTSGNEEFFTLQALIKKFSLKRINKASAKFNPEKLEWLNGQHLKKISDEDYLERLRVYFPEESAQWGPQGWRGLCLLYRNRIKTLKDLKAQAGYCFSEPVLSQESTQKFFTDQPDLGLYLQAWLESAKAQPSFDSFKDLENMTRLVSEKSSVSASILIHPLRYALTGTTVSPGLFELMCVLGKETCLKRVQYFIKSLSS